MLIVSLSLQVRNSEKTEYTLIFFVFLNLTWNI